MNFINEFENYIKSQDEIVNFRNDMAIKIKQMNDVTNIQFKQFKQAITSKIKDLYLYLPMFVNDEYIEIKLSNGNIRIFIIASSLKITYRNCNNKTTIFDVSQVIYFNRKTNITILEKNITDCITQIIKIDGFINGVKK